MSTVIEYVNEIGLDSNKWTDDQFNKLHDLLEKEFPNSPFVISLPLAKLARLDDCVMNTKEIYVRDNRYWDHCRKDSEICGEHEIKIKQLKGQPITFRQILEKMTKNKEYQRRKDFDHRYLEDLEPADDVYITAIEGNNFDDIKLKEAGILITNWGS